MSEKSQNYFDELDQSGTDEKHFDLHKAEELLGTYKKNKDTWNKEERIKELEKIEDEIKTQKMLVKDRVKPGNQAEKERLSDLSEKVTDQVFGIFEHTNSFDEAKNFLESYYQRGKVDIAYGRAFILVCEDSLLAQAKEEYENNEENEKLVDFISEKNVELSKEIMSDDYVHLLEVEREFFKDLMEINKIDLI
ncbi:hypothetical protein [Staphylococcus sp. EZ-P03]|uniref:hypothetical protein n=1 Tax=Staphylococcus sp. EZ-P03 TaxID=2282739 RepID=UPI000DF777F0|nr:hypothetical protein [Staphylococcus sp. EZ-P03]